MFRHKRSNLCRAAVRPLIALVARYIRKGREQLITSVHRYSTVTLFARLRG